jgi:hypothetical protein
MSTPRVTVDETLSISRVTVADTAPRVVVSESGSTSGVQVTASSDVVTVVLSPTAAGVSSVNGLTGVVTVQEAVNQSTTLAVPGALSAGTVAQGSVESPGGFAVYAENPVFYGYNLTIGGTESGSNLQGITFSGAPSGGAFLGYNDSTDRIVQSRDGVIYYDIPVSTTELAEGTNLYYTDARADARVAAGIGAIDYPVDSVNGKINTVVLTTSDISEGTNKYYTDARVNVAFDTRLAAKTTDNLAQGTTNKYFANGLARSAISVAGSLSYSAISGVISYTTPTTTASLSNHTTDALSEGTTNKYYTDARADARVALGISNLVDSAPATLDTLNELAAALGDDPNFATTITTALGNKLATADFASTANSWLATKTSDNLTEGTTNKYFSNSLARSAISASGSLSYDSGTGIVSYTTPTTDGISEGSTNLYYTDARVTSRINNTSIDALSDVAVTTATGGQMLYYTGTAWVNSATVDSANINRFQRTASGTGSNAIVALSRNRTDAARATDTGPWLGFEYVGTDNTQNTSPQTAIRSMYDPGGNHKLQVLQLPGSYATPTTVAQIQRGSTFFNTTSGVANLLLTDTVARIGGNNASITNSANTATYASFSSTVNNINADAVNLRNSAGTTTYGAFASTGTTITGAGLHTLSRTTVGTPGATESRPSFNIQLIRSDQAAPSNNDGTGFRYRTGGSNGTIYTIADMTSGYSTTGDAAWFLNLANGDQTGSTFSSVNTIQSKVTSTTIRAGTASSTPGASTVSDIAVFSDAKILNNRPHRSAVSNASIARGSTYTPGAGVNNFIELTLTAGTDPTYIDVDNLTVAGEGGHQAILVYNNSGSTVGNGDLRIRNNGTQISDNTGTTIANGARIIFTVYCVGNYASCEYMTAA